MLSLKNSHNNHKVHKKIQLFVKKVQGMTWMNYYHVTRVPYVSGCDARPIGQYHERRDLWITYSIRGFLEGLCGPKDDHITAVITSSQ